MDFKVRYCCLISELGQTTISTIKTTRITVNTTTVPLPIDNAQCDRQEIVPLSRSNRIIGGSHAIPHSWPWIVFYEERKPCLGAPLWTCTGNCGGTLIDSRHVLTAAHCINTKNTTQTTITAGMHNKLILKETRQVKQVEHICIHPGYINNEIFIQNDIAILRLSSPVQINKYIQICCLPGPEPQHYTTVIVSGWGSQHMNGPSYHQLKQASIKKLLAIVKHFGVQKLLKSHKVKCSIILKQKLIFEYLSMRW